MDKKFSVLTELVNNLKKSPVKKIIDAKMLEFESVPRGFNSLFKELAFCILTAGTSAELGIKTMDFLGDTITLGTEKEIREKLKKVYRFHTIRAGYLFNARNSFKKLKISSPSIRIELVKNIKGIGMKEASHFLRNIGFKDYSIIDFHIVDVLVNHGLIEKPKAVTMKKYLEIEDVLCSLAKLTKTSLGELDLYLWYHETGKILK